MKIFLFSLAALSLSIASAHSTDFDDLDEDLVIETCKSVQTSTDQVIFLETVDLEDCMHANCTFDNVSIDGANFVGTKVETLKTFKNISHLEENETLVIKSIKVYGSSESIDGVYVCNPR